MCAGDSPPRTCTTRLWQNPTIRWVITHTFMRFPARMNPGIANRTKTSIPEYIFRGSVISGYPSAIRYTRVEMPKENAIGNLKKRRRKNKRNIRKTIGYEFNGIVDGD